jgi:uncharacterized membrane-anchored protein YhcB (DUF1043 family)
VGSAAMFMHWPSFLIGALVGAIIGFILVTLSRGAR